MIATTLAAQLLIMNAIGACLRWTGMVNKEFSSRLTSLILNICVPCLIFQSINNSTEFSAEALKNCMVALVLGFAAVAAPLLVGHLIYLAAGKSGTGRNIRYGLTFYHFSFMGIPVIAELFGDLGIFYYTFFLIPVRIGYYGLSEQLMTPPCRWRHCCRCTPSSTILTPPTIWTPQAPVSSRCCCQPSPSPCGTC